MTTNVRLSFINDPATNRIKPVGLPGFVFWCGCSSAKTRINTFISELNKQGYDQEIPLFKSIDKSGNVKAYLNASGMTHKNPAMNSSYFAYFILWQNNYAVNIMVNPSAEDKKDALVPNTTRVDSAIARNNTLTRLAKETMEVFKESNNE